MALHGSTVVRNHLLSALQPGDYAQLEPLLERVALPLGLVLIEAHKPIAHLVFPESGMVSTVADAGEGRIEVGVIGREGVVGVPVVLGVERTPHISMVQAAGEGLRVRADDLRAALAERPTIFGPLGLFVHTLMVQMGQTAYANATHNVEARLARWLLLCQDRLGDELPITHEFLGVMLGVRRPGVTTALHALEGMGSVRTRRGRVEVRDRDRLLELAGDAYQIAQDELQRVMGAL